MKTNPPDQEVRRAGWLAQPALSVLVAAAWLLLQQSLAPPQLITAAILGLAVPWLLRSFLPPGGRVRRWPVALGLLWVVLWDIVVSNLVVARIVLTPGSNPRPAWVPVDHELESPVAVTLLAAIITTTPGTVSCIVDEANRRIIVHALDCQDPAGLAAQIRRRYERPLKEILG